MAMVATLILIVFAPSPEAIVSRLVARSLLQSVHRVTVSVDLSDVIFAATSRASSEDSQRYD